MRFSRIRYRYNFLGLHPPLPLKVNYNFPQHDLTGKRPLLLIGRENDFTLF
jgi:hypothetical protein